MAQTETLTNLRTRVRQLADQENSTFITDTELSFYINSAYSELYDLLVQSGCDYFESTDTITTTGGASYALPSDFRSSKKMIYQTASGEEWPLALVPLQETHLYTTVSTSRSFKYRVAGSNVVLYPTPPSGDTYIHTYTPTLTALSDGGDTVDGVSGWEEYIVVDAAIQCLLKEESNPAHLVARKEALRERIMYGRADRHLLEYGRVSDNNEHGSVVDPGEWFPYTGKWWAG